MGEEWEGDPLGVAKAALPPRAPPSGPAFCCRFGFCCRSRFLLPVRLLVSCPALLLYRGREGVGRDVNEGV